MDAISNMEIGQIVDFIIEYNEIHDLGKGSEAPKKPKRRKATQADWDALCG